MYAYMLRIDCAVTSVYACGYIDALRNRLTDCVSGLFLDRVSIGSQNNLHVLSFFYDLAIFMV